MLGPDGKWIGYGVGDVSLEVERVEHRLLLAYPKASRAVEHGVQKDTLYTTETAASVKDLARFINSDPTLLQRMAKGKQLTVAAEQGVANLAFRQAIGAYIPPVIGQKYPIQGVFADSNAFLNPPQAHSFIKATNDFAAEGMRLYSTMVGRPIVVIGYSMGGVSIQKFLSRLPEAWRPYVKAVITFGDPSMPSEGSLNGNDAGEGISKMPQPVWCRDRYWSYSIDGDWYPRARGLLFFLYQILTRAEMTPEFALWLFTSFPLLAMQQLMGTEPSDDPLAGILGDLPGLMTTGLSSVVGTLLNPLQLFAILGELIPLLFDAIKFMATNAHGQYASPAHAFWDGMTAVDHAVRTVRERVPDGATTFLFPGTWGMWNFGFQFDVAARLLG